MLVICIDDDKMSVGSAIQGQPVHAGDRRSSTSAQHHIDVVTATETHVHPRITDDHLAPSRRQHLQADPHEPRERSYSASDRHPAAPSRTSSTSVVQYLSPDYGNASPRSAGRGRTSTARRRAVRRGGGGGAQGSVDGVGATIKRSSSATLVADGDVGRRSASSSSFGSGLHLGSSVTFRNMFGPGPPGTLSVLLAPVRVFPSPDSGAPVPGLIPRHLFWIPPSPGLGPPCAQSRSPGTLSNVTAAENHELFVDNSNGPRRSCSITLAYPSDSVVVLKDNPDGRGEQSSADIALLETGVSSAWGGGSMLPVVRSGADRV